MTYERKDVSLQTLNVSGIESPASRLGAGCASLGSRISRTAGLRALEEAFEHGINWFDVAPSYGDGQAQAILGDFASSRRGQIIIATKVGIRPPPPSTLRSVLKPLAQRLVQAAPGLRGSISAMRPKSEKAPLTGAFIAQSIDDSLRQLRTDHADVLLLHEPSPDDVMRDDVMRALQAVLTEGKARRVGIAGDMQTCLKGGSEPALYSVFQTQANPLIPLPQELRDLAGAQAGMLLVTHSAIGRHALVQVEAALAALGEKGASAVALLLDYAFLANPGGVILLSMLSPGHARENAQIVRTTADAGRIGVLRRVCTHLGWAVPDATTT